MSYAIYNAEGIILKSYPHKDVSKIFDIYTKEYGRISVHAQGIRKNSSKLRFGAQLGNKVLIQIVKGKFWWRLVGVSKMDGLMRPGDNRIAVVYRISDMLVRLLGYEQSNPELFESITAGLSHIAKQTDKNSLEIMEVVVVARIMNSLGYWQETEYDGDILHKKIDDLDTEKIYGFRDLCVQRINQGLRASHL